MISTTVEFTAEQAPCGKLVGGWRHQEDDDSGLRFDDKTYTCGCKRIRHEFHDGSVRIKTVRHDGKVLSDEHSADHEA